MSRALGNCCFTPCAIVFRKAPFLLAAPHEIRMTATKSAHNPRAVAPLRRCVKVILRGYGLRLALMLLIVDLSAAAQNTASPSGSLRADARQAIERGRAWLLTKQNSNGWWSSAQHPALT